MILRLIKNDNCWRHNGIWFFLSSEIFSKTNVPINSQWIIKRILPCIIKLLNYGSHRCQLFNISKRHGIKVNVFFLLYVQKSAQWHFYCGSFVSCLCVLNVWCVVAVSEYLMNLWQALHCCSSGHRVSGKTLSLVLPSVGINKGGEGGMKLPPATIQGSSMLTIKANLSLFLQVLLTSSKVKWQVLKEVYYTLHSNANPSIKL